MAVNWRAYVAELIGTFALVFFGTMAVSINGVVLEFSSRTAALIGIAFTHGLTLMVMVYALGHISGCHINPAVTVGMLAVRRIGVFEAVNYVIFQLIGASLAGLVHAIILPQGRALSFGLTLPQIPIRNDELTGLVVEGILTFFLVLVIFGTAVSGKAAPGTSGLAIGTTLAAAILIGGPLTGGALNPARSFGPAVASGIFRSHWIYWVGPVAGAVIAALIYEYLFIRSSK